MKALCGVSDCWRVELELVNNWPCQGLSDVCITLDEIITLYKTGASYNIPHGGYAAESATYLPNPQSLWLPSTTKYVLI